MIPAACRTLLLLLAVSAASLPSRAADSRVAEGWVATLEETSALLRENRFDDARTRLERLKRAMLDTIGPGESADRLFAAAISQLAVAQAGAGQTDDAIWNWHVAQSIHPTVRNVDLSGYGSAGQLLASNILPATPEKCARPIVEAPVIRNRIEPEYPAGARRLGQSGIMIVQIRLAAGGRPSEPQVLKGLAAPITYAALDALRRWRFEPPKADDPQKDTPFCVTFSFRLR